MRKQFPLPVTSVPAVFVLDAHFEIVAADNFVLLQPEFKLLPAAVRNRTVYFVNLMQTEQNS